MGESDFKRIHVEWLEGIFFDGQIFDAYVQIVNLIKQAKRSITLIDNYIDETTLTMLSMIIDDVVYLFGASLKDAGKNSSPTSKCKRPQQRNC